MERERSWSYDWVLLLITLALVGLGLLMIGSATANEARAGVAVRDLTVVRQGINAAIALVALVLASLINYRFWATWRWVLYAAILFALAIVLVVGHVLFGAQSWFRLSTFALQPSELAKVVLIIVLAAYFASHEDQVQQGTGLAVSLLVTVPFLALVFAQPDMGTAAVLMIIWLGMLFVAGVRVRHIALLAVVALVVAPLIWALMKPYMRDRIVSFLHPNSDPAGKDYLPNQALISVGSGGLWGRGLGQGTQSQLGFLRVRHTDYIFSVLAEELGFAGSALLLVLMAGLLLRIIHVSARAGDAYGRLVASGIAIMFFTQVAVNVGFNIGLLPVTGLPLPLISYGGSSLITSLAGIGLVQSVTRYHQPPDSG